MTQHMKFKALIILALLVCALMTYLLLNPSQNIINLTYTIDAFDVEKNEMIVTLNIDNQTDIDFASNQWELHWNQIIGEIIPESLPTGVKFRRVNGNSYFVLSFGDKWTLKAGTQQKLQLKKRGIMSRLSLGPFGAFLVQNGETYPVHINVKWLKAEGLTDLNLPTSKTRYDQLKEISLIPKEKLSILLPTPKYVSKPLSYRKANTSWRVYAAKSFYYFRANIETLLMQTKKDIEWVSDIKHANLIIQSNSEIKDESYKLLIEEQHIQINASSYAGILYAIQSLVQLDAVSQIQTKRWPIVEINDAPRFAYRGFLLDISRNFYGLNKIKEIIDLMSLFKLNHLDLKLTDDEGWRLEIPGLPELTEVGAKRGYTLDERDKLIPMYGSGANGGKTGNGFLTQQDFVELIRYASVRNVTIIPQISFPSHARAAIVSMESRRKKLIEKGEYEAAEEYVLTDLNDKSIYKSPQLYNDNTINICRESSYAFFKKLIDEIVKMYAKAEVPLKQLSIGADELPFGVWKASPLCMDVISDQQSLNDLYDANVSRLKHILNNHGIVLSGWEDFLLEHSDQSQSETLIKDKRFNYEVIPYVWNNIWGGGREDMNYKFANLGFKTVMSNSSAFYFDMADDRDMESHGLNWSGYVDYFDTWAIDPENIFSNGILNKKHKLSDEYIAKKVMLDPNKRSNLIGIQSQLFGETVRNEKILNEMILPNLIVFAERAWISRPDWIKLPASQQKAPMLEQWNVFVNTLGQNTIPFLNNQLKDLNIHLPKPGGIIRNDTLFVRTHFPGIKLRYSTDGALPTKNNKSYDGPIYVAAKAKVMLRAFDNNNKGGKAIEIIR